MHPTRAWDELDPPWREAFQLAWDAFQAGSVAVGAVVLDPAGQVVSRGRNRAYEATTVRGALAGTYLAHAELNALAGLRPGDHWDHVLVTTLEPCLLCTAATTHVHVGAVVYAAADPIWEGIERLPELNPHIARRFHDRRLTELGPLSLWAGGLPKAARVLRLLGTGGGDVDSLFAADPVLAGTEAVDRRQADVARAIIDSGLAPGDGTDLPAALAAVWDALED